MSQQDKIKKMFQSQLITHYGDDTEQTSRILQLSCYELEQEVKQVFNIKSELNYFKPERA